MSTSVCSAWSDCGSLLDVRHLCHRVSLRLTRGEAHVRHPKSHPLVKLQKPTMPIHFEPLQWTHCTTGSANSARRDCTQSPHAEVDGISAAAAFASRVPVTPAPTCKSAIMAQSGWTRSSKFQPRPSLRNSQAPSGCPNVSETISPASLTKTTRIPAWASCVEMDWCSLPRTPSGSPRAAHRAGKPGGKSLPTPLLPTPRPRFPLRRGGHSRPHEKRAHALQPLPGRTRTKRHHPAGMKKASSLTELMGNGNRSGAPGLSGHPWHGVDVISAQSAGTIRGEVQDAIPAQEGIPLIERRVDRIAEGRGIAISSARQGNAVEVPPFCPSCPKTRRPTACPRRGRPCVPRAA